MILDFVFPKKCVSCGKVGLYLCKNCFSSIKIVEPFCPICSKNAIDGVTHFGCRRKLSLDGAVSLWRYEGAIRKAILKLKYNFTFDLAKEISLLAYPYIARNFSLLSLSNKILVPIPLSSRREKWRGFNQAEFLGRMLAKYLGWKFSPNLLLRKRFIHPQTGLRRKERIKNIRGSFEVNSEYKLILEKDVQIVVFDDVWTTGATIREAGKALKRKGFSVVWGFALAKT